jgi:hypothetical protein
MFKPFALFPFFLVLSVSARAAALPGNSADGKKLHDATCLSCHNDSVYKRQDRQIKNIEGLKEQIGSCGHMTNITLGKPQVNDLVKYLNETYYKFK